MDPLCARIVEVFSFIYHNNLQCSTARPREITSISYLAIYLYNAPSEDYRSWPQFASGGKLRRASGKPAVSAVSAGVWNLHLRALITVEYRTVRSLREQICSLWSKMILDRRIDHVCVWVCKFLSVMGVIPVSFSVIEFFCLVFGSLHHCRSFA